MRRDALRVLTNNCEDNEYIQVFMVLFLIRIQSTTHTHPSETFHRLITLASFYIITPENNMTSIIVMIRAKQ